MDSESRPVRGIVIALVLSIPLWIALVYAAFVWMSGRLDDPKPQPVQTLPQGELQRSGTASLKH